MAKHTDKTGRSNHVEQWTKLVRPMMATPAWKVLSPKAQALYPWLKFEWHGPRFNNNGRIQFSCRQAKDAMGIGVNSAMHAFRELQEKGFIVVTRLGALGVEGAARGPSYELTEIPLPGCAKPHGRRLYKGWRAGNDYPVAQHPANNPNGRNGRISPSRNRRQTCLQSGDVPREPISKTKTPHHGNRDVDREEGAATVIDLKTSLVTRRSAGVLLPNLTDPVDPKDCSL